MLHYLTSAVHGRIELMKPVAGRWPAPSLLGVNSSRRFRSDRQTRVSKTEGVGISFTGYGRRGVNQKEAVSVLQKWSESVHPASAVFTVKAGVLDSDPDKTVH